MVTYLEYDMKKCFLLLLFLWLASGWCMAQVSEDDEFQLQFVAKSFRELGTESISVLTNFVDWEDKKYRDDNGQILACVRIKVNNMAAEDAKKLTAKVSSGIAQLKMQEFRQELMELWLWVSPEYFSIEVYGDGYKSRPYELERKLESKHFYMLTLNCVKQTDITVGTRPRGVSVYLDGKLMENNKAKVSSGNHSVSFSRDGRKLNMDTVVVVSDQNYVFFFDLRDKYTVNVTSEPSNADVSVVVDEKLMHFGRTPTKVTLPEGSYRMITSIDRNMSDTTLLNVSPNNQNVRIQLEKKKTVQFYALYQGRRVPAYLYITRVDGGHYVQKTSETEGSKNSFSVTLPYGRYQIRMANEKNTATRTITINDGSPNYFEFTIKPPRRKFMLPWQIDFDSRFSGFSLGYVQRSMQCYLDEQNVEQIDIAWGRGEQITKGARVGLHFQPCFQWGLGLYFGAFFEWYYSPTPRNGEYPDALESYYTSYTEKAVSAPLHLYFRMPFSREFALSFHGGVDAEYLFGAKYKDGDGYYMTYTPNYGTSYRYRHFNLGLGFGAGIQYEWALLGVNFSKGLTNHYEFAHYDEEHPYEKACLPRFDINFSILF